MSEVWVYKPDGTLQCGLGKEIPLDEMANDLADIIGRNSILEQEKRVLPHMIVALCGAPTGNVNAYKLTAEAAYTLFHGYVGKSGFSLWMDDESRDQANTPQYSGSAGPASAFQALVGSSTLDDADVEAAMANLAYATSSAGQQPSLVTELVGRLSRCYTTGDSLTLDYIPTRVNIEHNSGRRIVKIWFG